MMEAHENIWNVIVKDDAFVVVDARYGLPGQQLIPFARRDTELLVREFTVAWGTATVGQPLDVRIEITFEDDTDGVAALLVELPETFEHHVRSMTDARVNPVEGSPLFPLAPDIPVQGSGEGDLDTWLIYTDVNRLKIIVEQSERIVTIPAGTFSWSFSVKVPFCNETNPCNTTWPRRNF